MATGRGLGIVTDGLVFYYDTGNSIDSYKGEPTTNLQANGAAFGHNSGNYGNVVTVTDASTEKGPGWKKVTITNRGSNFRIIQFTYTSMSANTMYCHSAVFDWGNMRDKGYFINHDGNGTGVRAFYKPGDYTTSFGSSLTINSSLIDGKIAGTITHTASHNHAFFINNQTTASEINDYFYYKDYQVEVNSHPTQFTTGTRSATQGLLDISGQGTSIDLSNVSFDSNAQMTFDGTDDSITIPAADWNRVSSVTVEAMVKVYGTPIDSNDYHVIAQKNGGYSGAPVYGMRISNSNVPYGTFSIDGTSAGQQKDTVYGQVMTLNQYYHLVYTREVGTSALYQNGVATDINTGYTESIYDNTNTITVGVGDGRQLYGNVPLLKIYNRALTASEVKRNYDALKTRFGLT